MSEQSEELKSKIRTALDRIDEHAELKERIAALEKVAEAAANEYNDREYVPLGYGLGEALRAAGYLKEQVG